MRTTSRQHRISRNDADGSPETVLTPESLASVYGVEAYFGTAAGRTVIQPLDLVQPPVQDKPEEDDD